MNGSKIKCPTTIRILGENYCEIQYTGLSGPLVNGQRVLKLIPEANFPFSCPLTPDKIVIRIVFWKKFVYLLLMCNDVYRCLSQEPTEFFATTILPSGGKHFVTYPRKQKFPTTHF